MNPHHCTPLLQRPASAGANKKEAPLPPTADAPATLQPGETVEYAFRLPIEAGKGRTPFVGISNNMAPCDVVPHLPETAAAKQAAAGSKGKKGTGGGDKAAKGKTAMALSKVGRCACRQQRAPVSSRV